MERNREGYLIDEFSRECTNCGYFFVKTNNTMTLCKPCNNERVKSKSPEYKMHLRAKQRSSEKGIDFDIEVSDITIPIVCPILGIELVVNSGRSGAYKNSPSLDRIDNTKGYIKGNIQVISQLANSMKGAASIEDLQQFAKWINKTYPRKE
jgi:hypothetical protein